MFIPKQIRRPPRPAVAKRKNPDLATTSCKIRRRADVVSESILYEPHQRLLNLVCLTGSRQSHIPQSHNWHSKHPIAKNTMGLPSATVGYTPRIPSQFRQQIDQQNQASKGTVMAKIKFRPLHDRVVVKRIDADQKTKGGIIIPDTAREKPSQGEITAVGPGGRDESGKLIPIDLKVGDLVLFGKWSGTEVKLDGEDLLIMKESDIMGVLA